MRRMVLMAGLGGLAMSDWEIEVMLDLVPLYRDMLDEAATQGDVLWRNVAKLAGIGEFEMPSVREYLVRRSRPDPT